MDDQIPVAGAKPATQNGWRPFDPLRFPAREMAYLGFVTSCIGVAAMVWMGELEWGFAGWWFGTSVALVIALSYLERYSDWYAESFGARGWAENLAATVAPFLLVLSSFLEERPTSAVLGPLLCAPFFFLSERWRHKHLRRAQSEAPPLPES